MAKLTKAKSGGRNRILDYSIPAVQDHFNFINMSSDAERAELARQQGNILYKSLRMNEGTYSTGLLTRVFVSSCCLLGRILIIDINNPFSHQILQRSCRIRAVRPHASLQFVRR